VVATNQGQNDFSGRNFELHESKPSLPLNGPPNSKTVEISLNSLRHQATEGMSGPAPKQLQSYCLSKGQYFGD